jgi:glutathione peroxidase-family protein
MLDLLQKKYSFILNQIKKLVMSFIAGHVEGDNNFKKQQPLSSNQLTAKEVEVLLSMIKRTTFLGEDIEPLYNLVIKLQNQYIEQSK